MKRKFIDLLKLIAGCIAMMTMLPGCFVHEFPEPEIDQPAETTFTLNLDFDTEMSLFKELIKTQSRSVNEAFDVRHIVSVHRLYPDGSYDRNADTTVVFTCDDIFKLNCSRELNLRQGQYHLFVWTDYVNEGGMSNKYYDANDFTEIALSDKANHTGSTDFRDAFRGEELVTVSTEPGKALSEINKATVTMTRPLAKFKFISTDYEQFLQNALRYEQQKLSKGSEKDEDTSTNSGEASTLTDSKAINLSDYRVVFKYAEFMPCSYNMFTDKPADSWTGVIFEGELKHLQEQDVELGFDYVFVNGTESGVAVAVEIYHKDGVLVASSPVIDVPLKRSHLTVVKGSFLTSIAQGGVGIVPDFDGEYNIEIH